MLKGIIDYLIIDLKLDFTHAVRIDTYPGFVLRSVLGWQLKRMHCVMRDSPCENCPFSSTCAYAFIFESIIPKTTASLQGRDRASHPFRIWTDAIPGSIIKSLELHITLFGRARDYLPHVVYAFREAAATGLFKARTPAVLSSVMIEGQEILHGDRLLLHDLPPKKTELDVDKKDSLEKILIINCLTPLRFKTDGHYSVDFSGPAFVSSCLRRAFIMFEQYGHLDLNAQESLLQALRLGKESTYPIIPERYLRWVEFSHYSGRQKDSMQLGGVMGHFRLEGEASNLSWQAIELSTTLGAGKNCSFGFGNISIENT
jgi:hypothetical protein